jgi:hypothetical protein
MFELRTDKAAEGLTIPKDAFGAVPTNDDGTKALVATAEAKATREAVENFIVEFVEGEGGFCWKRSSSTSNKNACVIKVQSDGDDGNAVGRRSLEENPSVVLVVLVGGDW